MLIHLSIKIDIPLMLGYFGHIFNLPMKFFATRKTGDITTRYSDANTIKSIFTSIALSLVMDISMAVITGIILFRMNAMLFSISLFMALVSILLVLIYKQPLQEDQRRDHGSSLLSLNSQMIESLRGIETVKCNAERADLSWIALEREYIKSLKISLRSSRISTTQGLISSFISTGSQYAYHLRGHHAGAERRDDAGRLYGLQHPVRLLHLPPEQPDRSADADPGSQHLHEASDRDHGLPL
ncbi:MAG: ABC transporter transmembrane domain-containing protein [Faecalibacterium prausnitzii]